MSNSIYCQSLDYFINQGLQNSPLLKDYQNQINAATLDSLMVIASQRPQVNYNTQLIIAPYGNNFGYDFNITNGGVFSSLVGVSQNVFNKKILNNKYEGIDIEKSSVVNNRKISINDLRKIVTSQYLLALADYIDITFNKKAEKLIAEELSIMKQLAQQGIYKQSDYLSLLIETQNLDILSQQLKIQYQKDFNGLNQLCGISDTISSLEMPEIKLNSDFNIFTTPLLKQYKIDSLRISNERKAVDIRYIPKLSWFADAGIMGSDLASIYRHFGVSAGFSLSFPIYDGKQKKLDYQKLDISENTRESYLQFNKNQLSVQVVELNNELASTIDIEERLSKQMKTIEDLVSLSKLQLNAGNISIVEFVTNLRSYIDINRSYNQTLVMKLQIKNELNYYLQK